MMKVTSDGSTTPKDAINHAAKIMNQHVSYFMFDDANAIKAVNSDELNETLEVKSWTQSVIFCGVPKPMVIKWTGLISFVARWVFTPDVRLLVILFVTCSFYLYCIY